MKKIYLNAEKYKNFTKIHTTQDNIYVSIMVNLLCNFRKFTYDKRTKSVMVSQVKPEGPRKLGAEGAIPPPPPQYFDRY